MIKQNNTIENKAITRAIETWSINEIYEQWQIAERIDDNDLELIEKAVRDLVVSNQINVLLAFPVFLCFFCLLTDTQ